MATEPAVDQSTQEMALGEPEVADLRLQDSAVKQQRVDEFLEDESYDALLLQSQGAFAWYTSGGDNSHGMPGAGCAALLITPEERFLLCSNAEAARLLEEQVQGIDLQLVQSRWDQQPEQALSKMCEGKKVAADAAIAGTHDESDRLSHLRLVMTPLERQRYRDLGRELSQALESTARMIQPGMTEADVAAEVTARLIRRTVVPVELFVAGDDRVAKFRRPVFSQEPVRNRCMLAVTARKWGLCAAATRHVSFGGSPAHLVDQQSLSCMVEATYIFFSRPGEQLKEVFRRARRIYEKFGHPQQWTLSDQGGLTGYRPVEILAVPESPLRFAANMAVCWCPTVGSARSQDTVLIDDQGFEIVTKTRTWPTHVVSVKGYNIERPGILVR